MSRKVVVMCLVTIIVVSLSFVAVLYMLMPGCNYCGKKFCFGACLELNNPGMLNTQSSKHELPKSNQTSTRLKETEKVDPQTYWEDVYFVGDSRTVGLGTNSDTIPSDHVFAKNSSNHEEAMYVECVQLREEKLVTIPEAVRITAPRIIIVNFGINSAYLGTQSSIEEFVTGYQAFIDELLSNSPDSIIVLEAVMPVSLSYEQSNPNINNDNIDRINMRLLEMAQENGYYYLATNEGMKNEYNALKEEYSADGLHFNSAGYDYIENYILTHAIIRE